MNNSHKLIKLALATAFVAVVATGCRTKPEEGIDPNLGTPGVDMLGNPLNVDQYGNPIDPNFVDGDMPLADYDPALMTDVPGEFVPVYFDYNAYNLPASEIAKLDQAVAFMNGQPDVKVVITGHCDERGTNEFNMSLGEYRAQTLRDQLIAMGIHADRITTSSFGEEAPADPGHDEAAWAKNRRAEFDFVR